jgi:rod shape determining protein RodA
MDMMFDRRLLQNFDWVLLALLILIGAMSVLNLYSATLPIRDAGGTQILMKQIYWFLMGFALLMMITIVDYHLLETLAWYIYFFTISLLVLVLLIGKISSGSQRWLNLGVINLQPSELAKISLVIILAQFFSTHGEYPEYRLRDLWQPFILILLPCGLILKEPDLGSAMVLGIICFSIILIMKIRWRSLLLLLGTAFSLAPLVWMTLKEYQKKRIFTFLNPEGDPLGAGYHIIQSKIAVGSGLLTGKGYLKGTQTRLKFLPENHTDFAFSVWAEEWGFLGSIFLLMIYLCLVLWGINIAKNSKDKFGSILAIGITAIIFWQLVINVCMTIGLMPVVGIPLVLFSYGGSSVLSTMIGMGLLMNISIRRFMFQ